MKTSIKFIGSILMLLIIATTGLTAQDVMGVPQSPTNEATSGLKLTEVDQFMNVLDWSNVKFDKAFTYMSFDQRASHSVFLDLGGAFKAGPVYIGSWYRGKLGNLKFSNKKSTETTITNSGGTISNTETVEKETLHNTHNADHNAVVLVGFGNIGINFGYARTGKNQYGRYFGGGFSNEDTVTTNTNSSDENTTKFSPKGYNKEAKHTPFVGFGMNLALGKLKLSPKAFLGVQIDENSNKGLKTTTIKRIGKFQIKKTAEGKSDAYVALKGGAGVLLGLGDSINSSFDLGYYFAGRIYNKAYTAVDGKKYKINGTYKITEDSYSEDDNFTTAGEYKKTTSFKANFTKSTYFTNTLNLGYTMQKDFERVSVFAGFKAPVTISLDIKAKEDKNINKVELTHINPALSYDDYEKITEVTSPIETVKTTTINVIPELDLGLSYAAVPNKLALNLGTNVKLFGNGYTTTIKKTTHDTHVTKTVETTTYKDGRVQKNTTVTADPKTGELDKTSEYKNANITLKGGLCWNILDNLALDLAYTQTLLDDTGIWWDKFGNLKLALTVKF